MQPTEPSNLPPLAKAAAIIAFVTFAMSLLTSLTQPFLALAALVPLAAGIGILLKYTWSAYGFAILQTAGVLLLPLIANRNRAAAAPRLLWLTAAFSAGIAILFFFCRQGRSPELERNAASLGLGLPLPCLRRFPSSLSRPLSFPAEAWKTHS